MLIKNNTHYFNEYTRVYNVVPDTSSFAYQSNRRLSYYQRLYYELLYTQKVKGISLFYTLTYCDAKVPKFLGRNVHSYSDLRLLLNGSISKVLKRQYGSRLRYFVACECGEGEGKRGIGNNPHYHIIFFIQPLHDKQNNSIYDGYKRISVYDFTKILREFWLGSAEGYVNYKRAKYGIVKEGKFGAEILNSRAFGYVIKYVIKDSVAIKTDQIVYNHYLNESLNNSLTYSHLYAYYLFKRTEISYMNRHTFFSWFGIYEYLEKRRLHLISIDFFQWLRENNTPYYLSNYKLFLDWYKKTFSVDYANSKLHEFNNLYGPKVRISNGLGEYGIQFIIDKDINPYLKLDYCGNLCSQPPCLYYIRKLYYDVFKCPVTGNPLYRLNDRGVSLRCKQLLPLIDKTIQCVKDSISFKVLNNISVPSNFDTLLYCRFLDGEKVNLSFYDDVYYKSVTSDIIRLYAIYKIVYQYRNFDKYTSMIALSTDVLDSEVLADYKYFLRNMPSLIDYQNCSIMSLSERHSSLCSFSSYYVFEPYIEIFEYLQSLCDSVQTIRDKTKKELFAQKAEDSKKLKAFEHS